MTTIEIKVPALGESVVEATIARWVKTQGTYVTVDELILELETDKVTLEVTAPAAGMIETIFFKTGETVKKNDVLARINTAVENAGVENTKLSVMEESVTAPQSTLQTPIQSPPPPQNTTVNLTVNDDLFQQASPSVRKMLAENNLKAEDVTAHRLDNRLEKSDIDGTFNSQPAKRNESSSTSLPTLQRLENRVPLSRLRLRVAERLKSAQNTAAILTTFNEIDMSAIKQLRDRYKDQFEKKHNIKLGFMSFFVKACVQALHEIPMINSRIEGNEVVTNNYCDIGVAVSAPNGLVVPILRDADLLSIAEIEREIAAYGKKAKDGKLSIEEMSGGTFTLSNGGVFGSLLSTPILNPPQSGILGMHKIQDRPVAVQGQIQIRPMMYVALSYDHRLIDGREAVTFLVSIKDSIENPGRFLLDL